MATPIGELVVKIGADISGLKNGMKSAEEATSSLKTSILGTAAGVFTGEAAFQAVSTAVHFAADQMGDFIDEAQGGEVATTQINTILGTMNQTLDDNASFFDAAGKAAVQKGFDDEQATVSLAKLYQQTKDQDKAQVALTTAMDLARFANIGLEDAQKLVQKAYEGNTGALTRYGIQIENGTQDMDALAAIHKVTGDQADAFSHTAKGAMERWEQSIANVKQTIGTAFLPMFTKMVDTVTNFVSSEALTHFWEETVKKVKEVIQTLKDLGILDLVKQMFDKLWVTISTKLWPSIEKLWNSLQPLMPTFKFIAEVVGGALLGAFIVVVDIINTAIEAISRLMDIMSNALSGITGFVNEVKGAVGTVGNFVSSVGGGVAGALGLSGSRQVGGRIYETGVYMLHQGEEVVSAQNVARAQTGSGGGSQSVEVNFNNPTVRSDQDLNALKDTIRQVLSRDIELNRYGVY